MAGRRSSGRSKRALTPRRRPIFVARSRRVPRRTPRVERSSMSDVSESYRSDPSTEVVLHSLEIEMPQCSKGIGTVITAPNSPGLIDGVRIQSHAVWPDDRGHFMEILRVGQGLAAAFPRLQPRSRPRSHIQASSRRFTTICGSTTAGQSSTACCRWHWPICGRDRRHSACATPLRRSCVRGRSSFRRAWHTATKSSGRSRRCWST